MPRTTTRGAVVVAERYELLGEIGRGGAAIIYEARDHHLDGRIVALKVLDHRTRDRNAAKRLAREARVVAALDHPNVCSVVDAGWIDSRTPFLVMDRLYGRTLRDHLAQLGRLDLDDLFELGLQILSALEAVHAAGVVHRDIKPANLFLATRSGCAPIVKLLDFGMCRRRRHHHEDHHHHHHHDQDRQHHATTRVDQNVAGRRRARSAAVVGHDTTTLTYQGMVVGTAEYMAPEQVSGERSFDERIDLFATGVVLFEALTGEQPFLGDDNMASMLAVLAKPLPPLRMFRGDVPSRLERSLTRALERNASARYHTAAEFLVDLAAAKQQQQQQQQPQQHRRAPNSRRNFSMREAAIEPDWDMPTRQRVEPYRSAVQ